MHNLVDEIFECEFKDMPFNDFPIDKRFGLIVKLNNVKYEFLIDIKSNSDKLICLGSGALNPDIRDKFIQKPRYHRHSWPIKSSVIYYNDPTRYVENTLMGGWGIGVANDWYLENIKNIIVKITQFFEYSPEDLIFYGSSLGGFMSIMLSTMVKKSTALADVPQLTFENANYFNYVKKILFPNLSDETILKKYKHRLNVLDLMKKEKYIPNLILIFNAGIQDINEHYVHFFSELNKITQFEDKYENFIKIVINPINEHKFMNKEDSLRLLEEITSNNLLCFNKEVYSSGYSNEIKNLEKENQNLQLEIYELKNELSSYKGISGDNNEQSTGESLPFFKKGNYLTKFNLIEEKNFFIIDSRKLSSVKSRLYGYAIVNEEIIEDNTFLSDMKLDGTGSYVSVSVTNDTIKISQDINGNYGIYLFKKGSNFVISNSFLKLEEYLKNKEELSLNVEYIKPFISTDICSYLYDETMINEISLLPRNVELTILKNSKKMEIEEIDYGENTIYLNSKEGIETLDKWFIKWSNIFRKIKSKTNNMIFDLTGGFDSRAIFAILNSSNINLKEIGINSSTSSYYSEDYNIASKIASDLNFELNKPLEVKYKDIDSIDTLLNISLYTKFGFNKSIYPITKIPLDPIYQVKGFGGENIRGYPMGYSTENVENDRKFRKTLYQNFFNSEYDELDKILSTNYNKLEKQFNEKEYITTCLYKETRSRYLYGLSVVERYLSNYIPLTPFFDPIIYKLNYVDKNSGDNNLLFTMIYSRYCPSLLNYEVEGGRKINESTIKYVDKINNKYPFKNPFTNVINKDDSKSTNVDLLKNNEKLITLQDLNDYLYNVFSTNKFKHHFLKYFSEDLYYHTMKDFSKDYIGSMQSVTCFLTLIKIIDDIEFSRKKRHNHTFDLLNDYLENKEVIVTNSNSILVDNINFQLPPGFKVKSEDAINSIKDGTLFFKIENNKYDLNYYVNSFIDYVKNDDGIPVHESFIFNEIEVHQVKNLKSKTCRYWFEKEGKIIQIYTYFVNDTTKSNVTFLINSII